MIKVFLVAFSFFGLVASADHQTPEIRAARPLAPNIKRIVEEEAYPPFVKECFMPAVQKLQKRADALGAVLKKETIKVEEIDARWYNPSKYVWFSAQIETPEGIEKITVLMQKPMRGKCF